MPPRELGLSPDGGPHDPQASRGPWLVEYLPVTSTDEGVHTVHARDPQTGERIGWLYWDDAGLILDVGVEENFRRRGVATAMLAFAWSLPVPAPSHGREYTESGRSWMQAVRPYAT